MEWVFSLLCLCCIWSSLTHMHACIVFCYGGLHKVLICCLLGADQCHYDSSGDPLSSFPADCGYGAPYQQTRDQHQLHRRAVTGWQGALRGWGEDSSHESALPQSWSSEGSARSAQFFCPFHIYTICIDIINISALTTCL